MMHSNLLLEDDFNAVDGYSREEFDNEVYKRGYVRLTEVGVELSGEFTETALKMIGYALRNEPEWFRL